MDNEQSTFKPGGTWDTTKLGTAIGTTASHEVGHSYSAGHDNKNGTNKMNSANSASDLAGGLNFSDPAKKTVKSNEGKPPCKTTTNYSSVCCIADWWDEPLLPIDYKLHEPYAVTADFSFIGLPGLGIRVRVGRRRHG